jgi:hypothetical protein
MDLTYVLKSIAGTAQRKKRLKESVNQALEMRDEI